MCLVKNNRLLGGGVVGYTKNYMLGFSSSTLVRWEESRETQIVEKDWEMKLHFLLNVHTYK
jgi:hypothetical protein